MPTILVVDDDPVIQKLLVVNFEMEGYKVVCANDGIEGIALTQSHKPDLILLDVMMPRMDGIEAVNRLKADPATASIPVILLSAKAQATDISGGLDAGAGRLHHQAVRPARAAGKGGRVDRRGVELSGPVPQHLLPQTAEVDGRGRLRVGGLDLCDLAGEYGTPLFVYDEAHLRARCREAVSALGDGVAYATKAFLCRAMAALAHDEGMCLDVSTGGEMHVALAAGVPADRLVLHGNNKSETELDAALTAGVGRIVVDSFDELDRLERLETQGQAVLVRVTPGVEAHTHEYVRTGQDDTKFGFGLSTGEADRAVARVRSMSGLRLLGVHAHIGSQIFRLDSFDAEVEALGSWFSTLGLDELCLGGGLGVPYVEGEAAPTIMEWAARARESCMASGIGASVKVTAEPGRSIVAAAAITLYTVGTIKSLPGIRTYVSVDGGMSDNPRPVLYGSGYEAFLPRAALVERPQPVTIVGKHCETGDVVVPGAAVPADIKVGDVLATPVTGAYGYSMASNYNKVARPAVVFVADGRSCVVVRRETLEDLLRLDS